MQMRNTLNLNELNKNQSITVIPID